MRRYHHSRRWITDSVRGVYHHKCAIAKQTEQAADLISGDETV